MPQAGQYVNNCYGYMITPILGYRGDREGLSFSEDSHFTELIVSKLSQLSWFE